MKVLGTAIVIAILFVGFVCGLIYSNQYYPAPEIVEVQHMAVLGCDSIQGPIDSLCWTTDTVNIPFKVPAFAIKGYRAPAFAIRGRSVVANDIMALNWQFFKTDTIAARCKTPSAVYDDVILIRKFYYRGGKR